MGAFAFIISTLTAPEERKKCKSLLFLSPQKQANHTKTHKYPANLEFMAYALFICCWRLAITFPMKKKIQEKNQKMQLLTLISTLEIVTIFITCLQKWNLSVKSMLIFFYRLYLQIIT